MRSAIVLQALPRRLVLLLTLGALAVSGCGFHLSRPPELPFDTLYVAAPNFSSFGAELKRYLAGNSHTRLVDRPEQAQVILEIISEQQESQIVALSTAGKVNELLLHYRLSFSLRDRDHHQWIAPTEISLSRDMTYDDTEVLAKENEQGTLVLDMRQDAVRQVVRRLARARAPEPAG
jgi:LPS-assembly lipoprotein